jgi:RHS repeat-associated protein
MGFYTTATVCERREKMHVSRRSLTAKTAPPSKNRVWGFSATSRNRAWKSESQVHEPQQENPPPPTATASGVPYYGYRFYSPEFGRWVNRDPIEERGGKNLQVFVANQVASRVDHLGLWEMPWHGCCEGGRYNRLTHCCCCSGTRRWYGWAGCKKRWRANTQATGVKKCKGLFFLDHVWVEIGADWSAGFYPSGPPTVPSTGEVRLDDWAIVTKRCSEIRLKVCDHDVRRFKAEIKRKATSDAALCPIGGASTCPYTWRPIMYNCGGYWRDLINHAMSKSRGCSMP